MYIKFFQGFEVSLQIIGTTLVEFKIELQQIIVLSQ